MHTDTINQGTMKAHWSEVHFTLSK